MRLRLVHLYGDLMNLYGDRGNIIALQRRCAWRNIDLEVVEATTGDRVTPAESDMFFFGGGQDREQATVSADLARGTGEAVQEAVADGAALLAVCGGYQLLGHFFRTADGAEIPGVGLFDAHTVAGPSRRVGNVVAELGIGDWGLGIGGSSKPPRPLGEGGGEGVADRDRSQPLTPNPQPPPRTLVGFENHSGRTYLGPNATPLARVVVGQGNNGEDGFEGARFHAAVGTYLHGPVLPKNPWLADWLILAALRRRLGPGVALAPLDDRQEMAAHASVVQTVLREGNVRTSIR